MATDPDSLKGLLPSARIELARQIDAGQGDAARLVAECGWSWNLAFVLARAINGEGASNAAALHHEGIPAQAAQAIAAASAARTAPAAALALSGNPGVLRVANQDRRGRSSWRSERREMLRTKSI